MKRHVPSPEGLAELRLKPRHNYIATKETFRKGTWVNLIVCGVIIPECRGLGMERTPWV